MKELRFHIRHHEPMRTGRKRNTIRLFDQAKHHLNHGDVVRALFVGEDGGIVQHAYIRVTDGGARVYKLKNLPVRDCQRDGYGNASAAYRGLRQYYPELTEESFMAVINFEFAA